jgi:integrase
VKEYKRIVNTISKELGHIDITKLSQKDIAGYLEQLSTAEVFNKHRSLLTLIFRQAISDGLIENNIPERVLKRGTEPTKRSRLTLEQYTAIYAVADPAIQNAMELSLNTIQRRTDIKNWRFDAAKDDGFIYLIQSKTRKHGKSAYLRIPVSLPVVHSERSAKTLSDIIKSCRDDFVCPFIIHRPPKRRGIEMAAEKDHLMQLTGDEISKGFAKARDKAGIKVEDGLTLPTFHELLSLGEYLRSQQGWTLKEIQSLRGHTSDKMTKHYLDGHDWTTVETPKCAH